VHKISRKKSFDSFCSDKEPAISMHGYVQRTVSHMRCSPECFMFALAYLRRALDRGVPISMKSVHRLYITALTIAAQVRDDLYYSMTYYGQVGGVSAADLGAMELHFLLDILDFRAEVLPEEYVAICLDVTRVACSLPHFGYLRSVDSEPGLSSGGVTPDEKSSSPPRALVPNVLRASSSLPQRHPMHLDDATTTILHQWTTQCKMFFPLSAKGHRVL